ncbi:uncharacterized protein PV09_09314 [Verruconis gallopava]|uniref:Altered inheritance of mitochondria protein 32 n=1 Tax=Verruconis gallopava TaxID=253628 RepID=A0A0D2AJ22_9PEZI|nr:uncharacterized protein PV09_09314 [Verruconis gallopava]KIV98928.1 hypothetical protein PV09_09314 [Verruconis gallopava]
MKRPSIRSLNRCSNAYTSTRSTLQWLSRCPEPTCGCQPMPANLDIDHHSNMTFSPYRDHILVCTGQKDWASKIEMDTRTGPVTRHIKTLLGPPGKRGQTKASGITPGKYHNPYSPHIITNASFPSSASSTSATSPAGSSTGDDLPTVPTSVYLFPSFKYVTLPHTASLSVYHSILDALIQEFVYKSNLAASQTKKEEDIIRGQLEGYQGNGVNLISQPVDEVVVLVCGHGGRDSRCGALGLPLQKEFEEKLSYASIRVLPQQRNSDETAASNSARVGLTSHIGGHKWAGNVIIYIPPTWSRANGHSLSGSALWYGRVEPKHVEGIVQETIVGGRLIKELWRGGMKLQSAGAGTRWEPITSDSS